MRRRSWWQIAAGFVVVGALFVVAAAMAWHYNARLRVAFDDLYQANLRAIALANAESALWELRYGFPQFMVLGPADRDRIVREEARWYATIERSLQEAGSGSLSPMEQAAHARAVVTYRRYIAHRPRWFELYGAGRLAEAADWRARFTTPYGAEAVRSFTALINVPEALEFFGGDAEFFAEMIQTFLEELPNYVATLDRAVGTGDAEALARDAHSVKGALAALRAEPGRALAEQVEELARSGTGGGARDAVAALAPELARLGAFLRAIDLGD